MNYKNTARVAPSSGAEDQCYDVKEEWLNHGALLFECSHANGMKKSQNVAMIMDIDSKATLR